MSKFDGCPCPFVLLFWLFVVYTFILSTALVIEGVMTAYTRIVCGRQEYAIQMPMPALELIDVKVGKGGKSYNGTSYMYDVDVKFRNTGRATNFIAAVEVGYVQPQNGEWCSCSCGEKYKPFFVKAKAEREGHFIFFMTDEENTKILVSAGIAARVTTKVMD